jgi:uncharacterized GH25 family protein
MKISIFRIVGLSVMLLPAISEAARPWLLPSQTVIARSGGWVAVDAAMADDLFSFNQAAMPIDALTVSAPDGQLVAPQNVAKGRSRTSFDLELRQPGTYRIALADDVVSARWEEDGKPKRWRGAAAEMATGIPGNAAKLEVEQVQRRVETFASVGTPTDLKTTPGSGIQLVPIRHPNDLYAREIAKLGFSLDGKPAKDLEILIIAGGTRYRDAPDEMRFKTDEKGEVAITWPAAGMYWLEATVQDENATVPGVKRRRASYAATFEVLPQ